MFAIYFEGQIKTPGAVPCVQGQRFLELHIGFFLFVACASAGVGSRAAKPVLSWSPFHRETAPITLLVFITPLLMALPVIKSYCRTYTRIFISLRNAVSRVSNFQQCLLDTVST